MNVVEIRGLTKFYGDVVGIENLDLDIKSGEVVGFLGPNGAGKSTTIRTLLGLIDATSGKATFEGVNALTRNPTLRQKVGYLPGAPTYYNRYKAIDFLKMFAEIRGANCDEAIADYAKRLNLDLTKKIGELSKGNRQKVAVIQAFMHKPKILFLDEPTSGLDPLVQIEFEKILDEAKARGAAVLLSSHVMSEVEHLADRVAIINRGKLMVFEGIATLRARTIRKIDFHFAQITSPDRFKSLPSVSEVDIHGKRITCTVIGSEHELLKIAVELGVENVKTHETSLEDIFLAEVGKK
ncbi:MAG: ABC transporter ATP-binding protein [Actinomycetales bacterium]|nr:ABC transporter ATP-binding protein [Actinomycetales bacterium]